MRKFSALAVFALLGALLAAQEPGRDQGQLAPESGDVEPAVRP